MSDIEFHKSPRGGRVATVCHDNAAKLNVIDGDGAEALAAAIRRAGEGTISDHRTLETGSTGRRGYTIAARVSGQSLWIARFQPGCQMPPIMPTFRARRSVPARVLATGAA